MWVWGCVVWCGGTGSGRGRERGVVGAWEGGVDNGYGVGGGLEAGREMVWDGMREDGLGGDGVGWEKMDLVEMVYRLPMDEGGGRLVMSRGYFGDHMRRVGRRSEY